MIIDLGDERKDYFRQPTSTQILKSVVMHSKDSKLRAKADEGQISKGDLRRLHKEGIIVVPGNVSLDDVLSGKKLDVNSLNVAQDVLDIEAGQVIILPSNYHIPHGNQFMAHPPLDSVVNLETMEVKRRILGRQDVPKHRLSGEMREESVWSPDKVWTTRFEILHENRESLREKTLGTVHWYGKDNHKRRVSLYRLVEGAELRIFQNLAAYKLLCNKLTLEVRHGKHYEIKEGEYRSTGKTLTKSQVRARQGKLDRYLAVVESIGFGPYLKELDCTEEDLIEKIKFFDDDAPGALFRVPSRVTKYDGDENPKYYKFRLTSVPIVEAGDPSQFSIVWNIQGYDNCPDKLWQSNRDGRKKSGRKSGRTSRRNDSCLYCAHEISVLHTARWMFYKHGHWDKVTGKIESNPFPVPTEMAVRYLDNLRNQAIVMDGQGRRKEFNKASQENMLFKLAMAYNLAPVFMTKTSVDPVNYMIRFVGGKK